VRFCPHLSLHLCPHLSLHLCLHLGSLRCAPSIPIHTQVLRRCSTQELEHSCPLFSKRAVRYIDEHPHASGQPLFLMMAWTEVHDPHLPSPPGGAVPSDPDFPMVRKDHAPRGYEPPVDDQVEGDSEDFKRIRQVQRSMLQCVDDATANITAALKRQAMWESTLMVWFSDNGGQIVEASNNAPLRGGKETAWEGGMRVVTFVSGGLLPKAMHGSTLDGIVSVADWYGTFAKLAGLKDDEIRDGRAVAAGLPVRLRSSNLAADPRLLPTDPRLLPTDPRLLPTDPRRTLGESPPPDYSPRTPA